MKKTLLIIGFFLISGCSATNIVGECDCDEGMVISGTDTAVIKISVGKDGMPKVSAETVILEEGQRIVWAGPSKMEIKFPKGSPFKSRVLETENGVINKVIPRGQQKEKEKKYKYDVVVDGKVLDPFMIIRRPQ